MRMMVDGDGCPVKAEVLRVAKRYGWTVTVVANARMQLPEEPWIEQVLVRGHLDAADNWIAEQCGPEDIVVTSDIPLAARCIAKNARVIDPRGRVHSDKTIGDALASRDLLSQLRDAGLVSGGPPPFEQRDRSRFLQQLDALVHAAQRGK